MFRVDVPFHAKAHQILGSLVNLNQSTLFRVWGWRCCHLFMTLNSRLADSLLWAWSFSKSPTSWWNEGNASQLVSEPMGPKSLPSPRAFSRRSSNGSDVCYGSLSKKHKKNKAQIPEDVSLNISRFQSIKAMIRGLMFWFSPLFQDLVLILSGL